MWPTSYRSPFVRSLNREASARHRRAWPELSPAPAREVRAWFGRAVRTHTFLVSEVADYELRRELLRIGAVRSIAHLDELTREIVYVPISTAIWRHAASLWAVARNGGTVTAPPDALDGDVLIAAQALDEVATVVTTNAKHFEALGVDVRTWDAVPAA